MIYRNTFFTSDWHIGHKNCIALDKRPFDSIEHMHKVLINNYNSSVKENDICYFLGDIGLCSGTILKEVVSQLNGTKICILGNHDKKINALYEAGFSAVMYGATLYIANEIVTLTHCPLLGIVREDVTDMKGSVPGENWHGESRHAKYSTVDRGQYHLHGHIHSPNGGKSVKILDKQYDVGVVSSKYRPVSQSTIESWISLDKQGKLK